MKQLHPDLWIADAPLRFGGLEVGARMTVMRLASGALLLHSPIAASAEVVGEVQTLGRVAHLVAPNRFHHLYVGEWKQACPEATVHAAPGVDRKRADLAIDGVLTDEPEPGWRGEVDQVLLVGAPLVNEVVFFHRASATLLVSDLAFHVGPESPTLTRAAFRLMGAYGRLTPTLLERLLVRDREGFRRALERVLQWPFERVVVAHGSVKEHGGRDELVRGYAWVLGDGPRPEGGRR